MGWLDKLMGRGKQAAGDTTGNPSMREEGRHEDMAQAERQREATERAEQDNL